MTVKFNKLEVGQQVEVLPNGSKDLNGYVPHVIEKISDKGDVVIDQGTTGENIPPFFVRPAAAYQGHYLTAIKDYFTAYDIIVPESTYATDRVPFRDIVIHGLWRNPIRGFSIPFPISIHPEGTGDDFQCFATVVFPGINDVGTTLRCGEKCPNPECGSVFQRDAHAFFQAVATTLTNHITTQVRMGKTYDEALDDWLEQVSQVFNGITADFIRSPSKGEGSGIAVIGNIADLEALVGQVSGGSRGRRRIR